MFIFRICHLSIRAIKGTKELIKQKLSDTISPFIQVGGGIKLCLVITILLLTSCKQKNSAIGTDEENSLHKHYNQGKLQADFTAKEGENECTGNIYYLDGKLSSTCDYIDGLKNGIERKYYTDGTLYRTREYFRGEMNGVEKRFYRNGKLKTVLNFKAGMPGKGLKEYDKDGKLKTAYPEFLYDVVYDRDYEKQKLLLIYFSDHRKDFYYYEGQLIEGKYFDKSILASGNNEGIGEIALDLEFSGEIVISAKYVTSNRAPNIIEKKIYVE